MKRLKSLFIYIIILAVLSVLVYTFAWDMIAEALAPQQSFNQEITEICRGEDDDIYLLSDSDDKYYITHISAETGRVVRESVVPTVGNSMQGFIPWLYVAEDGQILIGVYEYDEYLATIDRFSIYALDAELRTATRLYSDNNQDFRFYRSLTEHRILGASEFKAGNDTAVYMLIENNDKYRVVTYELKSKKTALKKEFYCSSSVKTGIVYSPSDVLLGLEGGVLFDYDTDAGIHSRSQQEGAMYTQFMAATGYSIMYVDGQSSDVATYDTVSGIMLPYWEQGYSLTQNADDPVTTEDIHRLSINSGYKAVALTEGRELYVSGDNPYTLRKLDLSANENGFSNVLLIAGVAAGLLLVSFLLWYLIAVVFKMRFPILVRQSLLMLFIVGFVLNVLIMDYMKPNLASILANDMESRLMIMAAMFASEVDPEEENYGIDHEKLSETLLEEGVESEQIGFALYEQLSGQYIVLRVSSTDAENGVSIASPGFKLDVAECIGPAYENGQTAGSDVSNGVITTFVRVPGYPDWTGQVFMESNTVQRSLSEMFAGISMQFNIAVLILFVLLFLSQLSTVRGIARLNKGVKLLASGDMSVMVVQHTGDEVESLAHSFNGMTKSMNDTFERMRLLNESYYRFVPERLVSLLGAGSIEGLGKQSHIKKNMVVLVLKFEFQSEKDIATTTQLFDNINEVIEAASSVVTKNRGMVYDFAYNGFNAVFEDRPEDAVSTAVAICQELLSLNERRVERGLGEVGLSIGLDRGGVMMGIIGDEGRMAPTAIGGAITSARSMAELCEAVGARILCSESVAICAGDFEGIRELGRVRGARGRLYEVFEGDDYAVRKAKLRYAGAFEKGLTLFYGGDYTGAKGVFMELVKLERRDGAARTYLYLADKYEKWPPDEPAIN